MKNNNTSTSKDVITTANKRIVCAVYTRVSSDEQNKGSDFTSTDNQREYCENYLKSQAGKGWEISPKKYEDVGFSGGNTNRPALKELFNDIRNGLVDIVLAYKYDRLSRSIKDFIGMLEQFERHKVAFIAVTQPFDTSTAMGRLLVTMLMGFAQMERELNSERTKDKREGSAKKGKWLGGYPIIGYDLDLKNKCLVVNEHEKKQALEHYETYLKVKSLSKAAKILNDKGYRMKKWVTKDKKKRGGNLFNKDKLSSTLKNPLYIGKVRHKEKLYDGEHTPIIPEKIWNDAQKLLLINNARRKSVNQDKHNFLLKGLVKCGYCDSMMTTNFSYTNKKGTSRKYFYYQCVKVDKMGKDACKIRRVPAREIENIVLERISFIGKNPSIIDLIVRNAKSSLSTEGPILQKDKRRVINDISKIENEAQKIMNFVGENKDASGNSFVVEKLSELQVQKEDLLKQVSQIELALLSADKKVLDAVAIKKSLVSFNGVFERLEPEQQKELLQLLIKEVVYNEDKSKITITFRQVTIKDTPFGGKACFDGSMFWLLDLDSNQEPFD